MSEWVTDKLPPEKIEVLVRRKFIDGSIDFRIGYLKHPAGVKREYYFVVPMYQGENCKRDWEIIGWKFPE